MFAWVFTRVGERMDVANIDGFSGFVAAIVGVAALLAAMTAASIYIAPLFRIETGIVFLLAAAIFGSVIIAVPVIKFWTQAKYFNAIVAWFAALAASAFIIVTFSYGFGSFKAGKDNVEKDQNRKAVNEVLNGK
jgi:hypothetical protein